MKDIEYREEGEIISDQEIAFKKDDFESLKKIADKKYREDKEIFGWCADRYQESQRDS